MGEVTITIEEYKKLLEAEIKVRIFSDFVKKEKYSIDRNVCGLYFGFEVDDARND